MIPVLADYFGIVSGIWLLISIIRYLYRSYTIGRIANWIIRRRIVRTKKMIDDLEKSGFLDNKYPDIDGYVTDLKLAQISDGDDNEKIEAINYVRHLQADPRIDRLLRSIICGEQVSAKVTLKALEVLQARLAR